MADLRLYLRVVETGSLRAAAAEIGSDPSNVSRRLSSLERRLGVRLIKRSRIRSAPTDAGSRYYRGLKTVLEQVEALEDDVVGAADEPRGTLRVAAPLDFGASHVGPWLQALAVEAPRLSVDLLLGDRFLDMTEQGVDVAIRIGVLKDSALKARRLGSMPLAIIASADYLTRRGTPETPDDLADHAFILHSGLDTGATLVLTDRAGETRRVRCTSRFGVNTLGGVAPLIRAGAGLHAGPLWFFAAEIAAGRLVHVLPAWSPPTYPVHALYQPTPYIPAKIRRFVDLAATRLRATPGIMA